jgi:acyl-coenzyme A thioesterase PaaI-like protein
MARPHPPAPEALEQYAARCNAHPSLQGFGVRVSLPDPTRVTIRVDSIPATMRGGIGDDSIVNGGVLSALCDALIGCTAGLVDPTSRSATVQLAIRFERPLLGELIEGEARVDRATSRLIFSSAEIRDGSGEVCVRCQGIASLVGSRPGAL